MASLIFLLALSAAAWAQQPGAAGNELKQAGVCSRCHVVAVLEWSISRHAKAGTTCTACHGASTGHVLNERDEVKPDHIPHGAAIAALCAQCHSAGCPKTRNTASCQTCHHVHALVNPAQGQRAEAQPPAPAPPKPAPVKAVPRRNLQGFELTGDDFDPTTGLPREVTVAKIGTPMLLVPDGNFDIGADRFANARPVHTVHVEAFYLGKFEVTGAEWARVMGTNPSAFPGDRMPVERVSWEDCQAFVKKLNGMVPGGGFRLPTEAEWEYACRAGSRAPAVALADAAWFRDNTAGPAKGEYRQVDAYSPRVVGTRAPNRWGFYDMQGNVWEWCSSLFRPYLYDAADGREDLAASGLRVVRGGGFADSDAALDPGFRHAERPGARYRWDGLRLARSVPAER